MKLGTWTFINATTLAVILGLGTGAIQPAQAQTFTLLHTFAGPPNDGANPVAGLVQDAVGNLYGTTQQGGKTGGACANSGLNGCGTIFKLDPSGKETILYLFTGGADGEFPSAGLVLDGAGNLYGTTTAGGVISTACGIGCGTIFKLTPAGAFSVLHSPGSSGGLVMDAVGNLYGSTTEGIFKLALNNGTYSFTVLNASVASQATLALDSFGNLYGTRTYGGLSSSACGKAGNTTCGFVFKVDAAGNLTTLYKFTDAFNGGFNPIAGPILDPAGNLYGSTPYGGTLNCSGTKSAVGCGTAFEVTQSGVESVYSLTRGGDHPVGGLVRDAAGNLYGTTMFTGPTADSLGTVFEMRANGTEAPLLHEFSGPADGNEPVAGLVLDSSGDLYGTAQFGGVSNMGTVFKINPNGLLNYSLAVTLFGSGTVTGSGLNCTSNCAGFYASGTMVTLTATPPSGSSFVGWSGGCTGTSTCSVIMSSSQSVGATFDSDFSLSSTPLMPSAVSAGGSSASTITVVPAAGGFFSSVALTCAVTPTPALAPTCLVSPASTAAGTPATLTVNTTGPAVAVVPSSAGIGLFYTLCLPMIGLVGLRVRLGSDKRRGRGKQTGAALIFILLAALAFQVACGGSDSHPSRGTPPGPYTITVTGTYSTGSLVHSTAPTLTVQ
jgi:uncharacterized repeat protein (TIGR03803 family)